MQGKGIVKRMNPKANPNNALQLTDDLGWCCDDTAAAPVAKNYKVIVALSPTLRISKISLGGVESALDGSYDPNQPREILELKADIERVVVARGYAVNGCVDAHIQATNLVVELKFSTLVANYINTTATPFVATNLPV
jgi:hypothetical protein